jgi:putative DNA primase/helicase
VNSRRVDVAEGQDESGQRYLSFRVDGAQLPSVFPVSQLNHDAKPLLAELGRAGIKVFTRKDRDKLLTDLQNLPPQDLTFRVATQIGWHGKAFVLPDQTFGSSDLEIIPSFGDLDPAMLQKYRVRGSSDDWNERIGKLCVGNSRLMTAACISFAGAILVLADGPKTGGFQLVGNPEDGKTTAAMVAGSVVGCHQSKNRQGFIESWHTAPSKLL